MHTDVLHRHFDAPHQRKPWQTILQQALCSSALVYRYQQHDANAYPLLSISSDHVREHMCTASGLQVHLNA